MGGRIRAFAAFWYDFVVGDDWLIAVGVVLGLGAHLPAEPDRVPAWWLLPLFLVLLLPLSLWRATRRPLTAQRLSASSAYTRAA